MRRALVLVVLAALVACKKKEAPPQTALPGDGGARSGAADGPDGVDEADVRAGKRTGLGRPDEKPEVATEPLARGLVRGEVMWNKVVDRTVGVVELRAYPATDTRPAQSEVAHRCGAELERAISDFMSSATAALDAPGLVCDNVGLAVTIAGVTSHAVCSIASPSGDGLELDLVFVPDPKLGLRLIGMSTADALTTEDALRDQFDEQLGRFGARCP